jgi:hypothetical protein
MNSRMEDPINWTLDELTALYQLHPELCDVYVEGDSDQGLVSWFLEEKGRKRTAVYPASVVTLPPELVLAHGLPHPSRRSEAIVLALELEVRCSPNLHVTAIADLDFDCVLKKHRTGALLLFTDYTSMEMYAFSAPIVSKLLRILAPRAKITGAEVLSRITELLKTLFALRLANHELGFGLTWLSHAKCTRLKNGEIQFDFEDYVARYLNAGGKRAHSTMFGDKVGEIKRRLLADARLQIRGHDFIEVLAWYLCKSFKSCKDLTPNHLKGLLMVQLAAEDLESEELFKALLKRTADC